MRIAKNKYKIGTITTSILLAILMSMFLGGILGNLITTRDYTNTFRIILIFLLIPLNIIWALKKPKSLEFGAYGIAILLLFQWSWDWYVKDWNFIRTEIAISSIIALIVNALTGAIRLTGAKKTFKGQLGLK